MHRFIAGLRRAEDVTARACLAGCAALVFVAAISRALGSPIIWAIDIAMLLFIWCAFLGADAALRAKQHIIIDIVVRMFPQRVQRALLIVHWSVMIAFLLALVVLGGACIAGSRRRRARRSSRGRGESSPAVRLRRRYTSLRGRRSPKGPASRRGSCRRGPRARMLARW